jgi:FkbM family methyltransferase
LKRSPSLAAKRLLQTVSAFDNGPRVLWDITRRTPTLTVRTKQGLSIECPNVAGARVPLYELFAEDAYRIGELTAGLRADLVALDIGGQVGCFSTAFAQAAPGATVHAFEASPSTAAFLQRNVVANGFADRVQVHATALSDHVGTLRFASSTLGSGLNGVTSPEAASNAADVPCVTFAAAIALAGGRVEVVKMDVEGSEYDIVLGSTAQDWATVERIAIEFHGVQGRHWHELRDFFASAGLTLTDSAFGSEGYGMLWFNRDGR